MKVVGYTIEGKRVVDGIYYLYETYGLPIDIIIHRLSRSEIVVCWVHFLLDAQKAGANMSNIKTMVRNAHLNVPQIKEKINYAYCILQKQ